MSDAAGQKAMLTFVEILMNSGVPLAISQLAGHFGSRSFDAEMRAAAGGNEAGLKKLLLKYPSLFSVKGNLVSLYDRDSDDSARSQSPFSDKLEPCLPDVSTELEAVKYFQNKFIRKRERWMPICSLAGHLSQASKEIRNVIGPQLQFKNWLLKHPHIFEVSDESVGLQEDIAAVLLDSDDCSSLTKKMHSRKMQDNYLLDISILKSKKSLNCKTNGKISREILEILSNSCSDLKTGEYSAILYLVDLIDSEEILNLEDLYAKINLAPRNVQNIFDEVGILDFIEHHPQIFAVDDGKICLVKSQTLRDVDSDNNEEKVCKEGSGKIYHVEKLWGIIDLGDHEHVFFDRSIFAFDILDLRKDFRVGDMLNFRGVPAPKKSRAKWKALKVWKAELDSSENMKATSVKLPSVLNTNELLLTPFENVITLPTDLIDQNHNNEEHSSDDEEKVFVSSKKEIVDAEEAHESSSEYEDDEVIIHSILPSDDGEIPPDRLISTDPQAKMFVSVACQTLSTGDIIATSLYQSF